jgi:aminoglycoside 3-N-acetyltransferase
VIEDALGERFPEAIWEEGSYSLPCLDRDGTRWEVPVRPFAPTVASRRIDYAAREDLRDWFRAEFERAGLRVNGQVGEAEAWFIPARGFYDHLQKLAEEGITAYSTPEQLAARPLR